MKASFLLIAVLLSSAALIAAQTNSNSVPDSFPLALWKEHKKVTEIPWTLTVGKAYYRSDLRQELPIGVTIRPADLEKSGDNRDLIVFARVLDGIMPITSIHSAQYPSLSFFWRLIALVRPGKYKLEAALLDRATGRYSTLYEEFSVSGNENDPLEQALQRYPRFEFVETAKPEVLNRSLRFPGSIPFPRSISDMLNASRATVLTARDLGVSTDPPPSFVVDKADTLHLSVVTIFSPPEQHLDNDYLLSLFQNNLTNFLSAFSRLDVVHGTAKLTGVDITNRALVFDRRDMKEVTREILDDAITAISRNSNTVSVDALAGKADRGRFFRDVLRARFEEAENESDGAEHVIIVVAVRSKFPKGSSVPPLTPERDCHCRVIYVRFALQPNESDDIDGLLKAYKPRVFEPLDWQEFRRNFATIYEQLIR